MKKRPGLIRWNFFSYLIVIAGLGCAYIFLGLDGHVKSLIEQKLGALNGAPVVITKASFKMSGPRIEMETLAFKDPLQPDRTQYEIDKVVMNLELQALLRNRLVITDSFASGVRLHPFTALQADPKHASFVTIPEKQSLVAAAEFLADPKRRELPPEESWSSIPSVQASNGLASELKTLAAKWQKAADEGIEESHQNADALKAAREQNNAAQTKVTLEQLERSRLRLTQLEAEVKADGNVLLSRVETLRELLPHDITVIKQGVKLPSLEFTQIGAELGALQVRSVIGVVDNFRFRLLPWLEKKEQILKPSYGRLQGTDFYFTGRLLPPRLWVKKLELTSKENAGSGAGDVIGRINDLSSEPSVHAAHMSLQASFGKAEVSNLQIESQIDHRNLMIDDRLQMSVASFPIRGLDYVKTPTLRMGIEQANANLSLEYLAVIDQATLNIKTGLDRVSYRVETPDEQLKKTFDDALSPLTTLNLEASAQGKSDALHWTYAFNLSDRMRSSMQQVLSQEYAEFSARIRERADQKILEEKRSLETQLVAESETVQQKITAEKEILKGLLGEGSPKN